MVKHGHHVQGVKLMWWISEYKNIGHELKDTICRTDNLFHHTAVFGNNVIQLLHNQIILLENMVLITMEQYKVMLVVHF
jgi:hypothetical protein